MQKLVNMSQSLDAASSTSPPSPRKTVPRSGERRKVSTACAACQRKKTRCSGGSPCSACQTRASLCHYDAASDQRRKIAQIRNVEELARKDRELHRNKLLLGGLLAVLRSGDPDAISRITSLLRQDCDISNLRSLVEDTLVMKRELLSGFDIVHMDDKMSSASPGSPTSNSSSNRFSHDFLINAPITVNADPWTKLASSDEVSHLLSVYFTWEHPLYQFIDKSMFLIAYKSYNTSHKFCSKMLVHAILAMACLITRRPECKALQNRMFDEAKLHLDIELGAATIPTIQALLIMHQFEGNRGRDRVGRIYRHQAMDTYRRLGYTHKTERPSGSSLEEWRAITMTIWGVFAADSLTSFFYGFSPAIKPPSAERCFIVDAREDLDERDGHWSPYPLFRPSKPAHFPRVQNATCDLAEIYHEINILNDLGGLGDSKELNVAKREEIFYRLRDYEYALPANLKEDGGASLPHVYYLNSLYHLAYIILLRPLQEIQNLNTSLGDIDKTIFDHACRSIGVLWKARSLYTFEYSPTVALICPVVVAYTLIAQLHNHPAVHPAFTRACQAIYEHCDNLPVAHYLLAGITLLARQYPVDLTDEDHQYVDGIELHSDVVKNLPMDMPILLEIGDNLTQRGDLAFDSMGDFLTKFSSVSLRDNLSKTQ